VVRVALSHNFVRGPCPLLRGSPRRPGGPRHVRRRLRARDRSHGNGAARVTQSTPADLAGFIDRNGIYFQYVVLDPGANALRLTLTDYAAIETR